MVDREAKHVLSACCVHYHLVMLWKGWGGGWRGAGSGLSGEAKTKRRLEDGREKTPGRLECMLGFVLADLCTSKYTLAASVCNPFSGLEPPGVQVLPATLVVLDWTWLGGVRGQWKSSLVQMLQTVHLCKTGRRLVLNDLGITFLYQSTRIEWPTNKKNSLRCQIPRSDMTVVALYSHAVIQTCNKIMLRDSHDTWSDQFYPYHWMINGIKSIVVPTFTINCR